MNTSPERTEAADYYFKYIDQVPAGDIRELLEAQSTELRTLLSQKGRRSRCIAMPRESGAFGTS